MVHIFEIDNILEENLDEMMVKKSIKTAEYLSKLDVNSTFVTSTTENESKYLEENFKDLSFVFLEEKEVGIKSKLSKILKSSNENIFTKDVKDKFEKYVEDYVNKNDIVLVSGNYNENDLEFIANLGALIKSKTRYIILDLNIVNIATIIRIAPQIIKVSTDQFQNLFEEDLSNKQVIDKLHSYGVDEVMLTQPSCSIEYCTIDSYFKIDSQSMKQDDEALLAGLIYGLKNNLNTEDNLKYASACENSVIYHTRPLTIELVKENLDKVKISSMLS